MNAGRLSIDVGGGFYTVAEAARLLNIDNYRRISRWLAPTPSGGEPVVLHDYARIGREQELSFLDLVEIKFVEHFRQAKISLQSLRRAAKHARAELRVSHPFATSNLKFQTDRKEIFLETAKEMGDRQLLNLMTKQVVMYEVIERMFAKDLEFDVDGFARMWRPAPAIAPNVIVAPVFAFGRPVIASRHVPTRTLFESWLANNQLSEVVADWFCVDSEEVDEAVRFELRPLH